MDEARKPPKPIGKGKRRFRGKVRPRVSIENQVIKGAVPEGSRFNGHQPFLVQDLVISAEATCYQREADTIRCERALLVVISTRCIGVLLATRPTGYRAFPPGAR
jgi:hypothetical protein